MEAVVLWKGHEPTTGLFRDTDFKATIFSCYIMFPFSHKSTNLDFFIFKGYWIENILQQLTGLQFDICDVIKTRVGFKIAEMTRFLNYTGRLICSSK